jgi:3-methylfumaryl-CoA hydratase
MNLPVDIEHLRSWIGKREVRDDLITSAPLNLLASTLDREDPAYNTGIALPAPWHWLYFLPDARMSEIGVDGHPARGGFLPPIPLPRRMWAASRIGFHQPLQAGDAVTRITEISDIQLKDGKSGSLVFVKLKHAYTRADGLAAITEVQDIVYRDDPKPDAPPPKAAPAPTEALWRREVNPDPVLLFRYSALTFNSHRIHYDRPYAINIEGYPGLVVHGPLVATLLLDHLRRCMPGASLRAFEFRAVRPLFDGSPFQLCAQPAEGGKTVRLWAQDGTGNLCMDATATVA